MYSLILLDTPNYGWNVKRYFVEAKRMSKYLYFGRTSERCKAFSNVIDKSAIQERDNNFDDTNWILMEKIVLSWRILSKSIQYAVEKINLVLNRVVLNFYNKHCKLYKNMNLLTCALASWNQVFNIIGKRWRWYSFVVLTLMKTSSNVVVGGLIVAVTDGISLVASPPS